MNSRLRLFLLPLLLLIFGSGVAQTKPTYEKELFVSQKDTLPYRILFPKDFNEQKSYPLLVFLHGSGERGNDNEAQLVHGSYLFLEASVRKTYPAIVVFPQCPTGKSWNNATTRESFQGRIFDYPETIEENETLDLLEGLLKDIQQRHLIDEQRIYLGGLSMGGMGTFEMLHRNPELFAAAFAICGGANPKIAEKIKDTPIWIFHGKKDDVVPAHYSEKMHEALKAAGGNSTITLYPKVKHDSWTNTFEEPQLLPWLFSKSL
ncbi:prolyl oligopeptidase family serine peptidase [Aureisphaera galaxeae]|uniref:carboxylesterase family protein n=1 Tax=Aureisphaera galaxeae TaxID=1538023 RepID=UPI002350359D|nr:prolyl oligopeptidase family serine peptidase [Aureisphaera galaxeae]MDC8003400.1 prolyl oligopeptidase family serine peptidase [Aureisphaera galaxeae]